MKIIAILENVVVAGGVFNQSMTALNRLKKICDGRFDFQVLTLNVENIEYLNKLNIDCTLIKLSILDKIAIIFGRSYIYNQFQRGIKLITPFEKKIIKNKGDLVYFLDQSTKSTLLHRTNFIATVFDLCHRDLPEFPEVSRYGEFRIREHHFQNNISQATSIITESEELSDKISNMYGIDRARCLAIPLSPSPFMQLESKNSKQCILIKYNLIEGYLFYPAQFWPHKNHIRILQALMILKRQGKYPNVVFAGGNKGNRLHVEKFISKNKLDSQVKILGFVPAEDMRGLYEACLAVVMPTYFGPTNIPPLEAWMTMKPVIYSKNLSKQVGDAAVLVNPDDANDLANAMEAVLDAKVYNHLVYAGVQRLLEIDILQSEAECELLKRLEIFSLRRQCWH
jgi:glycosyltransferase involved in cell wall biosynthesis